MALIENDGCSGTMPAEVCEGQETCDVNFGIIIKWGIENFSEIFNGKRSKGASSNELF
jgi:hypothetical protein